MNQTFGWRNFQFTDTHCGTPEGLQLWYDLNGQFNVCGAEVVETEKVVTKEIERMLRTIVKKIHIKRAYLKISYFDEDGSTRFEMVEIREEEVEAARAKCSEIYQKIAQKNERDMRKHLGE